MNARGHNERSFRLDALAAEAREGLAKVEQGEEWTIGGWLAYGHALNEGRALFPGDREFGEWVALCQLDTADRHDRAAAMWAAANADQFEEARQRGNPRTIRGIHAKWKEIEAERAEAERQEAERKVREVEQNTGKAEPVERPGAQEQGEPAAPADEPDCQPDEPKPGTEPAACQPEATDRQPDQEPEPAPDPYGYAKLTEEALLDLANGLRADLEDEKARRKKAEAERDKLKAQVKEITSDEDAGRKIGNLMRRLDQSEGRAKEHQANAARLQRQVNAQKAEIKNLRQQLEGQEIAL